MVTTSIDLGARRTAVPPCRYRVRRRPWCRPAKTKVASNQEPEATPARWRAHLIEEGEAVRL